MLPLVGLITGPLLARALGPEGRGELASVLQPLTVIDAILLAGVPTAVTFFVGRGQGFSAIRKYVGTVVILTVGVTAIIMFLYSSRISDITGMSRGFIFLIWCTSFLGLLIALQRSVLQGWGALGRLDTERALFAVLRLFSISFLVFIGITQVEPYVIGYLLPGLIAALVLFPKLNSLRGSVQRSMPKARPIEAKAFYVYVLFAGSGQIANVLNSRLDQAALPLFLDARDLGMYAVAVTVAEIPLILSTVTSRNLLSETSKGSPRRVVLNTAVLGNGLVGLSAAILWVAAPFVTTILFGDEFAPASNLIRILVIGTLFSSLTASVGSVFAGTGRAARSAIAPVCGTAIVATGLIALSDNLTAHSAALLVVTARILCTIIAASTLFLSSRILTRR
ncbi:hypothetical protein LQU92_06835 [Kocuria sp. LUK]|uniref:hypothetical protein n=1 Tax=Kocuria sp. LUK TaxID=2897828 RepID=UPI001E4FFACD|nr:hypothetical protein [Kocuria sp. LUK]MCD1144957.1 hypothetical protein [Kocuria sp. LUK]